jgi:hypothetical protein
MQLFLSENYAFSATRVEGTKFSYYYNRHELNFWIKDLHLGRILGNWSGCACTRNGCQLAWEEIERILLIVWVVNLVNVAFLILVKRHIYTFAHA